MIGSDWETTTPWAWSLDTMIAGHVADVAIEPDAEGFGMREPIVDGDRVVVGPTWWDNHSVEERRVALLDAIGGFDAYV